MPTTEPATSIQNYPMSIGGVNISKNVVELHPKECVSMQNVVYKNGIRKRKGNRKVNSNQVVASKKILGVHKFYYSTSKQLLAACDTKIVYENGGVWTDAVTGLTSDSGWRAATSFATSVFDAAATNLTGISIATDGTLWVSDATTDKIYHITNTGTLISSFATSVFDASATDVTGVSVANNGTLWVCDADTNKIYHLELLNNSTTFTSWGATSKCYIANGVDAPRSWTGSAAATVTAAPSLTKQFLPYQDRLLSIDNNNRGFLRWSASFSDSATWETAAACGVQPDTDIHGMIHHSFNNSTAGPQSAVLLAGASDMFIFQGASLVVPFTAGNYTIFPLGLKVGCSAVRTMAWTPIGTIWLGNDRQVYLLRFDSATAIPISQKIYSFNNNFQGLEKIPSEQIKNACGIYHEGYYKLSFAGADSTLNNFQFWLDINNFYKDDLNQYGPWYGKMTGQTIGCYAVQNGTGDGGELVMGEQNETTGGFVYIQDNNQVYGDQADSSGNSGTAIDISYQTFYNPLGDPNYKKIVPHIELEALTSATNITMAYNDIDASAGTSSTFTVSGTTGSPARKVLHMSPVLNMRRLSLTLTHSSATADFQIYSINAKTKEMFLPFT